MAEDMQHIGYGPKWQKVHGVDLPAAEAHFHEICQKNFYASHSNFQHNKKIVSKSDETDFFRKSSDQGYSSPANNCSRTIAAVIGSH